MVSRLLHPGSAPDCNLLRRLYGNKPVRFQTLMPLAVDYKQLAHDAAKSGEKWNDSRHSPGRLKPAFGGQSPAFHRVFLPIRPILSHSSHSSIPSHPPVISLQKPTFFSGKRAKLSYTGVGGLRLRYDCTYDIGAPARAKPPRPLPRSQGQPPARLGPFPLPFTEAFAGPRPAPGRDLSHPHPVARAPPATA